MLKRQKSNVDNLYESRKSHYISFIKERQALRKTAEHSHGVRMQTQPASVFKFSESFFYDELNIIKKKKNKSPIQTKGYRIKSETCSSSNVVVFEPSQLISRK